MDEWKGRLEKVRKLSLAIWRCILTICNISLRYILSVYGRYQVVKVRHTKSVLPPIAPSTVGSTVIAYRFKAMSENSCAVIVEMY